MCHHLSCGHSVVLRSQLPTRLSRTEYKLWSMEYGVLGSFAAKLPPARLLFLPLPLLLHSPHISMGPLQCRGRDCVQCMADRLP